MEKTLRVLNRMVKAGVIERYAIGGAVAAIFYIEPINTNHLDIFFHVKDESAGLDVLAPLCDYLAGFGYKGRGETIEIEGWPVQFLPIFNPLLEEAVERAKEVPFQKTKTWVIQAEHLVAIMLQTGRPKDHARIVQFIEHDVVDPDRLTDILGSMGLKRSGNNLTHGMPNKKYPDVTELLKQKAQRRKRLAQLSFEEKIAIVSKWRRLVLQIRKSQRATNSSLVR